MSYDPVRGGAGFLLSGCVGEAAVSQLQACLWTPLLRPRLCCPACFLLGGSNSRETASRKREGVCPFLVSPSLTTAAPQLFSSSAVTVRRFSLVEQASSCRSTTAAPSASAPLSRTLNPGSVGLKHRGMAQTVPAPARFEPAP